jgi:membrane-bound lytic murein transglycosylase A
MRLNPRYAFFTLAPDDGRQPVGTANTPLPPGRALAVDPAFHPMGDYLWIDASAPMLNGAFPAYRRIAMALDTGGAIKGEVRADLYLGQGSAAGLEAGRVRHTLKLYRLVPKEAGR